MALESVLGKLAVLVTADTSGMTRNLTKAKRDLRKSSRDFSSAASTLNKAFTLPFAALSVVSVRSFSKFDDAMTQSLAIMKDVSGEMRGNMVKAADEIARKTTFSASQAAESYFFLASAGLDAEKSISALPVVAKFAQAGMFDMAQATDLLTDAQSALGLESKDLVRVSDVLVKANTLANASVQQFSEALTNGAAASLKIVGKEIEEGVAVLAAFADQGIKGTDAGTKFSIVMRDLQTKAIQNKVAFKEMGISVFNAAGEMNNIGDIIGDLEKALAGSSDEVKKATLLNLGFSDKSVKAIASLLGTSPKIKKYYEELQSAAGETEKVAGKQLKSFKSQVQLLTNELDILARKFGEEMAPSLGKVADSVKGAVKWFGELDSKTRVFIIAFLGIGTAAAIVTIGLAGLLGILGAVGVTGAVVLFGAKVAAVSAILITFKDEIRSVAKELEDVFQPALDNFRSLRFELVKRLPVPDFIKDFYEEGTIAQKELIKGEEERRKTLKKSFKESKQAQALFVKGIKFAGDYKGELKKTALEMLGLTDQTKKQTKALTQEEIELEKLHDEFREFQQTTSQDIRIKGFRRDIDEALKSLNKANFDEATRNLKAALITKVAKELQEKYKISFEAAAAQAGLILGGEFEDLAKRWQDAMGKASEKAAEKQKKDFGEAVDFWSGHMEDAISGTRFDFKEQLKKIGVDIASNVLGALFGKPGSGGASDFFGNDKGAGDLLSGASDLFSGVLDKLGFGGKSEKGTDSKDGKEKVEVDTTGLDEAVNNIAGALQGGAVSFAIGNTISELSEIGKNTEETIEGLLTTAGAILGGIFFGPVGAAAGSALGDILGDPIGKLFGDHEDQDETARKDFRGALNQLLKGIGGLTIFGGNGPEQLNSIGFNNGVFDKPGSAAIFQELAGENIGSFGALGEGLKQFLGVTEDIGPQIGLILAENLGGNIDNARLLVQSLGIDLDVMAQGFIEAGLAGEKSWHEVEVMLQGLTDLQGKGLKQVGDITGAYELLTASAGRGAQALQSLRNLSVEAQEAGADSLKALQAQLIASGQFTEDEIAKLFTALEQRGVTSLEDLENASDRTLGGVIADMESLGFVFDKAPEAIHKAARAIESLDDALGRLPDKTKIEVEMLFKASGNSETSTDTVQAAANGLMSPSGITPFAKGGMVSSPQMFGFSKGGIPSMGLMGEAGPEAILPLDRNAQGVLGVKMTGGGGSTNNININIEVIGAGEEVGVRIREELEDYFDTFNTAPGVVR